MKILLCLVLTFATTFTMAQSHKRVNNKSSTESPAAYALWNIDSDQVLVEKNIENVRPMASITKLMTVLVTLHSNVNLDDTVAVTGQEASNNIRRGMMVTRRELINLALVSSDNLAARTLSETSDATYTQFIERMNLTAKILGMNNTQYHDSTGLLAANVSTPADIKILIQATENYPIFKQNAMTPTTTVGVWIKNKFKQISLRNTNQFAGQLDLIGAKTGYTTPAGRCLTMFFTSHGQRYVLVVLGAQTSEQRRKMVKQLIDTVI